MFVVLISTVDGTLNTMTGIAGDANLGSFSMFGRIQLYYTHIFDRL